MKILITDEAGKYTDDFLNYVLAKFKDIYYEIVDERKLAPFEVYINELPRYKSLMKNHISAKEICITALYNIRILHYRQDVIFKIDETVYLPNTRIKLIELCKLINDGTLLLRSYPIFTEIFDWVKDNIEVYYAEYILSDEE